MNLQQIRVAELDSVGGLYLNQFFSGQVICLWRSSVSRIISADRLFRSRSTLPPSSVEAETLRTACAQVHKKCLAAVTALVELGFNTTTSNSATTSSEAMALLLSCAQLAHSTLSLLQTNADLAVRTSALCAEACLMCANALSDNDAKTFREKLVFSECAQACRSCADACFAVLRTLP
jgi:hypothetical protein